MDTQDILTLVSIITGGITIITFIGKVFIVGPLKNFIKEQTYPIQPHANGGRSLADVARSVAEIKMCVDNLSHQVDRVESRLDTHIEQHVKGEA